MDGSWYCVPTTTTTKTFFLFLFTLLLYGVSSVRRAVFPGVETMTRR